MNNSTAAYVVSSLKNSHKILLSEKMILEAEKLSSALINFNFSLLLPQVVLKISRVHQRHATRETKTEKKNRQPQHETPPSP